MPVKNNISVIITVYNYEKYVRDAINSVIKQNDFEKLIKEIIIVNDGSTDLSAKIISEFRDIEKIKIINKENGGQLSAFNSGIKYCTGDIVCFLDADDLYKENYLSEIHRYYNDNPNCDFLSVRKEYFGKDNYLEQSKPTEDIGYTLFAAYFHYEWIGTATSAISIKKHLLEKILPLPEIENEWRVRADDCLVWGSSLVGARKHYLNKVLVMYRTHENNNHYSKKFDLDYCLKRKLSIDKMFRLIISKNFIKFDSNLLIIEFRSKENKKKYLFKYIKIVFISDINLMTKLKTIISLIKNTITIIENKNIVC